MKRLAENDLKQWRHSPHRKPLILRGARQVGKSTLVRQFAQNENLELCEINLEERPLKSLKGDGYPLDDILQEIEFLTKKKIDPQSTLLFIDEIQAQPKAINLLRYFYEKKKNLMVITAGSLLEIAIKQAQIQFPVGRVDFYQLGPMTFYEFLLALQETQLTDFFMEMKNSFKSIPPFIHESFIKRLKDYYFVGGLPEAISVFIQNQSLTEVNRIHSQLIQTYKNDFYKYASRANIPKLAKIFDFTPGHLGQKVKYVEIDRDIKSTKLQECIQLLTDARIISPVHFSKANTIPLKSQVDLSVFKLFFLDIGLCNYMNEISLNDFYQDEFSFFLKGQIGEQFCFQHLYYGTGRFESPSIYYWLNEKKNANAEIDFLIEKGDPKIIMPIEVKSGSSLKLKSLIYFVHEKKLSQAITLTPNNYSKEKIETHVFNGKEKIKVTFELSNFPIYMAELLSN
jgi:predicted AAA+ superfamily ATPase